MCGCFKCVSEARHKRGGCFDEIQPFRSISVSFCGGVLNRQIHSEKLKTIHSDIHREIHSSINRIPQLNPQLKLGGGEGGYDLSPSLGPWAVEIHFRYSTFCHAGFVGPLQTYSWGDGAARTVAKAHFQNAYNLGAPGGFINSVGRALDLDLLFCVVNPLIKKS